YGLVTQSNIVIDLIQREVRATLYNADQAGTSEYLCDHALTVVHNLGVRRQDFSTLLNHLP
ncbi:hypothetical protein ACTHEL_004605, partial [Vibrio parahaemolyticus]